jgi:hypothetical protein
MRKFYVRYEYNWHTHAGPEYGNTTIALTAGEKANIETFNKKLKDWMRVISWSLIEE